MYNKELIVIDIKKLILVPIKKTINNMCTRSYVYNEVNLAKLAESVQNELNYYNEFMTDNNKDYISERVIANNNLSIVKFSECPFETIPIPNGWNTERFSFLLEYDVVVANIIFTNYVQGFTDKLSLTESGEIAPDTVFYVNNISNVVKQPNINGAIINKNAYLTENFNVINCSFQTDHSDNLMMIRPCDMFQNIAIGMTYDPPSQGVTVVDMRASIEHNNSVRSNGINNTPTGYTCNLLNSFLITGEVSLNLDNDDKLNEAATISDEQRLSTDMFIDRLNATAPEMNTSKFTLASLKTIDDNTAYEIVEPFQDYFLSSESVLAGNSPLNENSVEAVASTFITHAISELVTKFSLRAISLTLTNRTNLNEACVNNVESLVCEDHINKALDELLTQCKNVIMPEIRNIVKHYFSVTISTDILQTTIICITVNDNEFKVYEFPTYANGLYTPIVTPKVSSVELANRICDVLEIMDNIEIHQTKSN